jgi:GH43 family beta-xylosidase
MTTPAISKPLILQRADPFIWKHTDGHYYFTGSVPAYDGVELRRATTIAGLAEAQPVMVWRKPDTGAYSDLIWAPEIHHVDGAWYVYFAAAPSREIKDQLFQHRMYVIATRARRRMEFPRTGRHRCEQLLPRCDNV